MIQMLFVPFGNTPKDAVHIASFFRQNGGNAFSAAGINQTRHQILLSVDVYTSILRPGFTASTKVSNEIAVAETVIVGSVPETYTYFSTTPDELEDTARDNIMNKG